MSISRAIKCDQCNHIEMLNVRDYDQMTMEGCAPGWIRLTVNRPHRYSFSRNSDFAAQSDVNEWVDLCSVSCATTRLYGYIPGE